jgi:hypothetical protein
MKALDCDRCDKLDCDEVCDDCQVDNQYTVCKKPGRGGCGRCDACMDWGDQEYHYRKDEGLI